MDMYKKRFGNWAEDVVCRYLVGKNYQIIDRQWYCRLGEVDIIANDPNGDLVFFEVRAKTSDAYGRPEESIGWRKQRSLARAISYYVLVKNYQGWYRCDVCAVEKDGRIIRLRHLKNVRLE
jgi:putative endonuclease